MRRLSQVCLAIAFALAMFATANTTQAQVLGNQVYEPDSFRSFASDINIGLPGRMWVRTQFADRGLGYQGTYATLGMKNRLFEDSWDGRWLGEARLHHSLEDDGGFFANFGIERVFSLESAGADFVMGFWYDYDGDEQGIYAHDFSQVSINTAIKTKKWDLIANGYFPVGTTEYTTAGPSGNNVFYGNNILLTPGIDSALQGFDVTLRMRPKYLAFGNGVVDFGGYGYSSDSIDFFSGGRARLGFQARNGMMIMAEVNHDDRFETTGVLGVGWNFGRPGARGDGTGGIGCDLCETVRGDHIVRFNQQFTLAIDPTTGLPYNVLHVNNTSDPAFENGSFENPFASLASAEAAGDVGDIIFVDRGDGSRQGLNTGIVLKDNQYLLGVGGQNIIPIQDNRLFEIPGEGARPTISNPGGTNVVTLANNNTVRGVNIDATDATNGIFGSGIDTGTIEDANITGANETGVRLENISGDWAFRRLISSNHNIDGIFIDGATDNQSVFTFENNVTNNNGFDGIHMENYRASMVRLANNTTNNNGRHGVYLENFIGTGLDMDIINHSATGNGSTGVFIDGGDGDLTMLNSAITNNGVNGIHVMNWGNTVSGDSTFIGNSTGGNTDVSGNLSTNVVVELTDINKTQDVLITGISVIGGGRGLFASASGMGTVLNMAVVENGQFSQHLNDGMRFEAKNSATLNVLVENTDFALVLNDNAQAAGSGIAIFADGGLGQPVAKVNAIIRNVDINNDLESGFATTVIGNIGPFGVSVNGTGSSRINLEMENSRVESAGGFNVLLDNDGNGEVNNIFLRDLVIRSDFGVNLDTQGGTLTDFALLNSDIQSNGLVRTPATGDANDAIEAGDPFTDAQGDFGFFASVTGDAGGALDNLTRIQFSNNFIRDFTFDAVTLNTFGDAQVLAYMNSNRILRNGPGIDNLVEFPIDDPATFQGGDSPVDETQLFFFDGVEAVGFDNSQISLRFNANELVNNYELGLDLQTFGTATINASINFNNFANDIGQDADATANNISTSFDFEFSAINGLTGTMCLDMSSNSLRALPNFNNTSGDAARMRVELDGATNGFTDAIIPADITTNSVGICEGLISDEELFFTAAGLIDSDTPAGGGFAPVSHD